MTTRLEVHLPRPHDKQAAFLITPAKRVVVKAGRRGGKTVGVAILAVQKFLEGKRILYATPTQEQIDRFWESCKSALSEGIDAGIFYKNETRHIIELPGTEQRIRAKTAWNADTLRGDYADILIMDEYQLMNEDAWEVVGAPMLLDNNGNAVFVYTPPSFRTAGASKARNKKHATMMFERAKGDKSGRWAAFHFTSHDNPHISSEALGELSQDMTVLSFRQEIMAEDIDEIPGALWKRETLEKSRITVDDVPELARIFIAVDPKTEAGADSETGIVAVGLGRNRHGYLLEDCSLNSTPEGWASQVVAAYHRHDANALVVEINQGGDMVTYTINTIQGGIPMRKVRASRSKATRAEPVAALYEQGKIHHIGDFPILENQLCSWVPGDKSPDRLDALVWGFTELMVSGRSGWARG